MGESKPAVGTEDRSERRSSFTAEDKVWQSDDPAPGRRVGPREFSCSGRPLEEVGRTQYVDLVKVVRVRLGAHFMPMTLKQMRDVLQLDGELDEAIRRCMWDNRGSANSGTPSLQRAKGKRQLDTERAKEEVKRVKDEHHKTTVQYLKLIHADVKRLKSDCLKEEAEFSVQSQITPTSQR